MSFDNNRINSGINNTPLHGFANADIEQVKEQLNSHITSNSTSNIYIINNQSVKVSIKNPTKNINPTNFDKTASLVLEVFYTKLIKSQLEAQNLKSENVKLTVNGQKYTIKIKTDYLQNKSNLESLSDKIFSKLFSSGTFQKVPNDKELSIEEKQIEKPKPTIERLKIPTDLKSFKTFQNIQDFINIQKIKDLNYDKADFDSAINAMNKVLINKSSPLNSPLSHIEDNLVTYYTETGYRNINDLLGNNLSRVATHLVESMIKNDGLDFHDIAINKVDVIGLNSGEIDFSDLQVEIKGERIFVKVLKDVDSPEKRSVIFELNDSTKTELMKGMKNILVQAHLLNSAVSKLPSLPSIALFRRLALTPEKMNSYITKYNRGKELPLNKEMNVSKDNIIVQENRFTSNSINPEKAKRFGGARDFVEFRIFAIKGKDITMFSDKDENEVLLTAGSKLQILSLLRKAIKSDDGAQSEALIIKCYQKE